MGWAVALSSLTIACHLVPETAPLAGDRGVLVALVKLDVLDGVAQAHLMHSRASRHSAVNLDDWHAVDELFCVGTVCHGGKL